jgi:outer membrane protein OmpA-like peptidoglycan-associated protein
MKSRLFILTLALAATFSTASAQRDRYTSAGNRNIFVSATGGVSMINTGKDGKFGDAAPHVTLSVGKWFNPVIGLRLQGGAWKDNFNSSYNHIDANGNPGTKQSYNKNVGIVRFDALYSLTNALLGYNPDRAVNISVFAGPGMTFSSTQNSSTYRTDGGTGYNKVPTTANKLRGYINGSAGLLINFYVSKAISIDLEGRGELAASPLGYQSTARTTGGLYFGAGLTWTIGGRDFMPMVAAVDNSGLNDEINRLRRELEECRAQGPKIVTETKTEYVTETKFNKTPIFFKIGSSKLDSYAKATIKLVADGIKSSSGKTFKVQAYADKATGSANFNQKLTDARAQAVYDALVAEGVPASQLQIVSNGGVDNLFSENETTRVVIMGID